MGQVERRGKLSVRALNRATLARQLLLARQPLSAVEAVEQLAGLQAQYSPSPYVALWSRLEGFRIDALQGALERREVVKALLMRRTLHLVSAREFPAYLAATVRVTQGQWERNALRLKLDAATIGVDPVALRRAVVEYCRETPRTPDEIGAHLAAVFPGARATPAHLWGHARSSGELVHAMPSGAWRYFGDNPYAPAETWVPGFAPLDEAEGIRRLLRRYLGAYGPAAVADASGWSDLRAAQLKPALDALAPEVVSFQDARGRTLYDLASAPRPPEDTPAPVRYLAKWDSLLLAFDDRTRVLPEAYRALIVRKNLEVLPTFLVDGQVAGIWDVSCKRAEAALQLTAFAPLTAETQQALEAEGDRLLRFMEPGATSYAVRLALPG